MRLVLAILFLAALPARTQPCDIAAPAQAALDALPGPSGANAGERLAAVGKIRDRFPQDYFVHAAYQDTTWSRGVSTPEMQGEYRALKDTHPDDPFFATLYARAMTGTKTPEAIAVLNSVLEKHPDYAYAHQKLAEIYRSKAFRDFSKFQAHITAYRNACPNRIDAYTNTGRVDDAGFLKQTATALRKLLAGRDDETALAAYPPLWTAEFKAAPLTAHGEVRERIRQDVARLRALDPAAHPAVWPALREGYKQLNDADGTAWVEQHEPKTAQSAPHAASAAIAKWRSDNPMKTGEKFPDYQARLAKQADEWIRQWPDDPYPLSEKFNALGFSKDTPTETMVALAEQWLKVYEAHPGAGTPYLSVAELYSEKNMRAEQLPGLLEKALKEAEERPTITLSDLDPPSGMVRMIPYMHQWNTWGDAAGIYIKLGQFARARELLSQLGASLDANKPADSAEAMASFEFKLHLHEYWEVRAKLAHAEGRKLDELVFRRNTDAARPSAAKATGPASPSAELRALWTELGGTDEGLDAFVSSADGTQPLTPAARPAVATAASEWTAVDKPLPEFHVSDASGKVWTLADLKGKVTLVNLWATWCAPCKMELPYLQKLFDRVRERKDVQVMTLNTDDNPGTILPFLAENKYTFPVLPALGYVTKLVPALSIPRNWIVDADGILRQERVGFGSEEKWLDETLLLMAKFRK